jgi:hypothetical protein
MLVKDAALPPGAVVHEQLLGAGGAGEAAQGAARQAQLTRDLGVVAAPADIWCTSACLSRVRRAIFPVLGAGVGEGT